MITSSGERARVADFWDEVLAGWVPGHGHLMPPLDRWCESYKGQGDGVVDLDHYPDPYIGDLRGLNGEPRLVFLGLNPGIGYDSLQGDHGTWTKRIRAAGYSRCFERSPAEDPVSWKALHKGKESAYWRNLTRFARRWLDDPHVGVDQLLNFELYPWHSKKVVGRMRPPVDLVDDFIWKPVQEVPVDEVFAFGRGWLDVCRDLDLEEIATWGPETAPVPGSTMKHWRVSLFRLPSEQVVVVSSQMGSGSPPGLERTKLLKEVAADHRS
ncbi:hypothetical protein [uncultured Nocardioides sp.]|uniref:anti-phage DNA glycosylase Brig1 n=1 Tax=uncultured Nocardioides sp. TaxID=198441 RepID=UPI00260447AB|nr:hypothetical protein [uncultured Nocardioides sp.]